MELNNTKCKAMRISRKNTPAQTNYSINGHIIEQVTNFKDLGVVVSKDLSWSQHINSIVSKANKTLGLIKRICKEVENVKTRRTLYCALVRPKLEYASNVWSPYNKGEFRSRPISAFVYIFALSQSECVKRFITWNLLTNVWGYFRAFLQAVFLVFALKLIYVVLKRILLNFLVAIFD
jgi:hypothetical protein